MLRWPAGRTWVWIAGGALAAALVLGAMGRVRMAPSALAGLVPAEGAGGWFRSGVGEGPGAAHAHAPLEPLKTGLESLPGSLQGSDVDGELPVDAAGHLRVVRGVRNCFDYFLSLVGEEPVPRVRERLQAYVRHQLKEPAQSEALDLLNRYLNYRTAVEQLAQQGGAAASGSGIDALRAHLDQQRRLRQQMFSPTEHAAFFGDEETLGNYSVASLLIMQDGSLNAREKAARIHQLNATLPPAVQEAISARERVEQLTAVTQQLRAEGASPEALRAVRVDLVGAEAADRLEALDAQRSQWSSRLQAFQAQRSAILQDTSLSDTQRRSALEQLAARSFNDVERVRALALIDAPAQPTR